MTTKTILSKARLPAVAILLLVAFWLLLGPSEAAYLAWTRGGVAPPSQFTRDLLAACCVVVAGVLVWVGRWRKP